MTGSILSPTHLALILVVVLLLFGAKRLPEIGRSLGTGLREFKGSLDLKDADGAREQVTAPPALPQGTEQDVKARPAP